MTDIVVKWFHYGDWMLPQLTLTSEDKCFYKGKEAHCWHPCIWGGKVDYSLSPHIHICPFGTSSSYHNCHQQSGQSRQSEEHKICEDIFCLLHHLVFVIKGKDMYMYCASESIAKGGGDMVKLTSKSRSSKRACRFSGSLGTKVSPPSFAHSTKPSFWNWWKRQMNDWED